MRTELLSPYQLEGADFLSGKFRAGLFDDMGLGKSAQAIRACDDIGAERILVICPATGRVNWGREFQRFQKQRRKTYTIMSGSQKLPLGDGLTIVNYDLVAKRPIYNQLVSHRWDVCILDESHKLKEPDALRTQSVYGPRCDGELSIVGNALYTWALSGTPMLNNALELWSMLHTLAPELILWNGKPLSWWQFLNRYCVYKENKHQRIVVIKGRNGEELKNRIAPFFLRRMKRDVLKDLPDVRVSCFALNVTETVSHILKMEEHPEVARLREHIEANPGADINLGDFGPLAESEHMATLIRLTGIVKAHAIVDLLKDELTGGLDKIVLMAWHREAIQVLFDGLNDAGFKTVRLQGGMTPRAQQEAIDSFQTSPDVRVFIGQISAAAEVITLTAASQLMFVEASWSPKINEQARDRVWRRGQKESVLVRFAYLPGSIDEAITSVLERKMVTLNAIMN
jgi:SNF2 family DNA or RNA helicase